MNEAELLEALRRSRFAKDVDLLAAAMRPSLRLSPRPVEPADLAPGASRLAGTPDLPPGFDWPRFEGRPLDFEPIKGKTLSPVGPPPGYHLPHCPLRQRALQARSPCPHANRPGHTSARHLYD